MQPVSVLIVLLVIAIGLHAHPSGGGASRKRRTIGGETVRLPKDYVGIQNPITGGGSHSCGSSLFGCTPTDLVKKDGRINDENVARLNSASDASLEGCTLGVCSAWHIAKDPVDVGGDSQQRGVIRLTDSMINSPSEDLVGKDGPITGLDHAALIEKLKDIYTEAIYADAFDGGKEDPIITGKGSVSRGQQLILAPVLKKSY